MSTVSDGALSGGAVPVVELVDVSVRFGGVAALSQASLRIAHGEFVVLVGANGSGKTTLLRALHGGVAHDGERRLHAAALRQAMVFQRPFVLRVSVRRNLLIALALARVPRAERAARAEQALRRVGLAALAERPARALSGGELQRFALARAWAVSPGLLFLDEPTANLDPAAKREVESLLESFARDGMTLVMSTHNLGQAKRLATRVVYLERGRIHADLPAAEFFTAGGHPAQPDSHLDLFLKGELPWSVD